MVQVGPRPDAVDSEAALAQPTDAEIAELELESPERAAVAAPRRRYSLEIPFDPVVLPYLALMLAALALRFYDLGYKALHHDESLHAVYSWYLYQGRGYTHDPMMHGPLLFELNALAYLLFGASDFTARLVPALLGVVLVGLPYFLRREMGQWAAVAASALFVISPTFLYFSRFLRHDIYVDVFTLLMMIGVFRYLASADRRWFYTSVVAAALLFATKEDFYISGFIAAVFFGACWWALRGEQRALYRARVRAIGWQNWMLGAAVFLAINVVLYTTFFTNMRGVCTAAVSLPGNLCAGSQGALNYWLDQHEYARGGQPWFYYLMLLPLYELLPLVLGALALVFVRGRRNLLFWFCTYWFVAALGIYSWAGEKMPWMLPQIAMPLVLLASFMVGQWSEQGWIRRAFRPRALASGGLVLLGAFGILAWLGLGAANTVTPIDQQTLTLQRLALSALIAAIAGGLVALWPRWGRGAVLSGVTLGVMAALLGGYVRVSLGVTYDHPDVPSEPLVYVQSSHDVVWTAQEIDRIAQQTGQGKNMPILMDNGWGDGAHESVAWPFEWYLRDYKNRRYFTKTIDSNINLADYPVLLVMAPNVDPIQEQLKSYTGQKFKLNWWFPEDYKAFASDGPGITLAGHTLTLPGLRLDAITQTLADPANRVKLLKFLLYREAPNENGAREYYFYVNNEIPRFGPAPVGGTSQPASAPSATATNRSAVALAQGDGSLVYGRATDGASVLSEPKNVALAPDGRLYVTEGKAGRITAFNPDGTIAAAWGAPGQAAGQFQEPWGIAIAANGDVYVADTWNHRVQRFDANGTFLGAWGHLGDARGQVQSQAGLFYGPRAIAISPQGEVYVTDTGNKRIEVFGLDGAFHRTFGGEGSAPGQFQEPVGIAADPDGTVWVADAWNHRVQHLDSAGAPLGAFPISGAWDNQSITNKPYLALRPEGQIVVTYPDEGKMVVYTREGQQVSTTQTLPGGTAVGVAVGPNGRTYTVDGKNGVVVVR